MFQASYVRRIIRVADAFRFRRNRSQADTFTLQTVRAIEYSFHSPNADDIRELILYFLDGLKKRSRYVVALNSQEVSEDEDGYLRFHRGDLIQLEDGVTGEYLTNNTWAKGENVRTGQSGDFASDLVYVIPTITKPLMEVLVSPIGHGDVTG